jgi:MFS family permease
MWNLGGSTSVAWAYPALMFGQTLSSFLFGRVSDISGRRWVFISASLLGFVAALACSRVSSGSTIVGLVNTTTSYHRSVLISSRQRFWDWEAAYNGWDPSWSSQSLFLSNIDSLLSRLHWRYQPRCWQYFQPLVCDVQAQRICTS